MTAVTMQPTTSLSPPLQVLLLQLFNLAVQNITRNAPVPGLGDICVADRGDLKAIINGFGEQDKKLQQLDSIIESKLLEVTQNSNIALEKMFQKEFRKLEDQTFAQYQKSQVCEELRKEKEVLIKSIEEERKLRLQLEGEKEILNKSLLEERNLRLQLDGEKEVLNKSLDEERKLRVQLDGEYRLYKKGVKSFKSCIGGAPDKLLASAKAGDTAAVKVLVDAGVDVGVTESDGNTPLHWAARNGHSDTVQALLDLGAKVDAKLTSSYDATPLYSAAGHGKVDVCRVLIAAGADVRYKRKAGWIPLHAAAHNGHLEVCRLLLDSGANIDELGFDNQTSLYLAAWKGRADVVRFLLERGANSSLKSTDGKTPLDIAREEGNTEVVAALSTV